MQRVYFLRSNLTGSGFVERATQALTKVGDSVTPYGPINLEYAMRSVVRTYVCAGMNPLLTVLLMLWLFRVGAETRRRIVIRGTKGGVRALCSKISTTTGPNRQTDTPPCPPPTVLRLAPCKPKSKSVLARTWSAKAGGECQSERRGRMGVRADSGGERQSQDLSRSQGARVQVRAVLERECEVCGWRARVRVGTGRARDLRCKVRAGAGADAGRAGRAGARDDWCGYGAGELATSESEGGADAALYSASCSCTAQYVVLFTSKPRREGGRERIVVPATSAFMGSSEVEDVAIAYVAVAETSRGSDVAVSERMVVRGAKSGVGSQRLRRWTAEQAVQCELRQVYYTAADGLSRFRGMTIDQEIESHGWRNSENSMLGGAMERFKRGMRGNEAVAKSTTERDCTVRPSEVIQPRVEDKMFELAPITVGVFESRPLFLGSCRTTAPRRRREQEKGA
ncbi:hypothetical protein K438DRAFT_1791949 [Mycena galopus ATCC 62051]|nr:hypothetical protein K438DRAFT_1791949 [Mycena galopus ATCC 62051]